MFLSLMAEGPYSVKYIVPLHQYIAKIIYDAVLQCVLCHKVCSGEGTIIIIAYIVIVKMIYNPYHSTFILNVFPP